MFFLFGWGKQTVSDQGAAMPVRCPNCNNETYWHLVQTRSWFTLFFIPIIPYSSRHILLCPICSAGMDVAGTRLEEARKLAAATAAYQGNTMSEEEYSSILDASPLCN